MDDEKIESYKFGFREVFRIFVPGIWLMIIFSDFFSAPMWRWFCRFGVCYPEQFDNVKFFISASVAGFFWFSLQLSKRLKCYKNYVEYLCKFMQHLKKGDKPLIDKPVYEYYISTILPSSAKVRIHYFASMYYMIMDIAIISFTAAAVNFLFVIFDIKNTLFMYPIDIVIVGLMVILGCFEWKAAKKILKDVMLFSLFSLTVKKRELNDLIDLAVESQELHDMYKKP